ncbi:MAG: hypothetical protein V9E87_03000 [Gemmatimonadales bacterium]
MAPVGGAGGGVTEAAGCPPDVTGSGATASGGVVGVSVTAGGDPLCEKYHPTRARTATTPIRTATRRDEGAGVPGVIPGPGFGASVSELSPSSIAANSRIDGKRSFGSFAIARWIATLIGPGRSGIRSPNGFGSPTSC